MSALKLLVHTCCGPCFIAPYMQLKAEAVQVTAFWHNPNIHPLFEYQKRRNTLREFCASGSIPLLERDEYGLIPFLQHNLADISARCENCYRSRLELTAKTAQELGFDAFTTTLLYSRYQKHDLIMSIGEELKKQYQVQFHYCDWRPLWQEGIRRSKEVGMYRQQYCGCIFSEEERYREQVPRA